VLRAVEHSRRQRNSAGHRYAPARCRRSWCRPRSRWTT
jgi:hypothetical protein